MEGTGHGHSEGRWIAGGLVGDDPTWRCPAGGDRPLEEPACGHHVPRRRDVGVHDLTTPVDGAVDVMPTAADPSVGLVHSPVWTHRVAVLSSIAEHRQEALYPA